MKTAKRRFEIEWNEDLGPLWMNADNLWCVMSTPEKVGPGLVVAVRDVTGDGINTEASGHGEMA